MCTAVLNELETFHGLIESTQDALVIFEACTLGKLRRVRRRLTERERKGCIRPGAVFVFDENESGIKRWTDGREWSPSRILGNFLVYRELERKIGRREGGGPDCSGVPEEFRDRGLQILGSTKGTFVFRNDGLIKKTISTQQSGSTQHLVYYSTKQDHLRQNLLPPNSYAELNDIPIRPEFVQAQNFRRPLKIIRFPGSGRIEHRSASSSESFEGDEDHFEDDLLISPEADVFPEYTDSGDGISSMNAGDLNLHDLLHSTDNPYGEGNSGLVKLEDQTFASMPLYPSDLLSTLSDQISKCNPPLFPADGEFNAANLCTLNTASYIGAPPSNFCYPQQLNPPFYYSTQPNGNNNNGDSNNSLDSVVSFYDFYTQNPSFPDNNIFHNDDHTTLLRNPVYPSEYSFLANTEATGHETTDFMNQLNAHINTNTITTSSDATSPFRAPTGQGRFLSNSHSSISATSTILTHDYFPNMDFTLTPHYPHTTVTPSELTLLSRPATSEHDV